MIAKDESKQLEMIGNLIKYIKKKTDIQRVGKIGKCRIGNKIRKEEQKVK